MPDCGDEYVCVATNVKKDDGSRAVGTILDPKGKAIASIKKDELFYREADILGKSYITGYDPIRDASRARKVALAATNSTAGARPTCIRPVDRIRRALSHSAG